MNMHSRILLRSLFILNISLIITAGLVTSCATLRNLLGPETGRQAVLKPLSVGYKWVYKNYQYQDDSLTSQDIWADSVQREFYWHGNRWYSFDQTTDYGHRNADDGLRILVLWADTSHYELWLDYKYPVAVGDTFGGYKGSVITCLSTSDTVTVPAGIFTGCVRYKVIGELSQGDYDAYDWFCPGVGWVKGEWNYVKDENRIHYLTVLNSYAFVKPKATRRFWNLF